MSLTEPIVFEFEYGASTEGHWNYKRMMLQLEGCVNVGNLFWLFLWT
jgi:hypothetical protein